MSLLPLPFLASFCVSTIDSRPTQTTDVVRSKASPLGGGAERSEAEGAKTADVCVERNPPPPPAAHPVHKGGRAAKGRPYSSFSKK